MSHLYITDNGSVLSIDGGRFVVTQKDGVVKSIPKETVESIAIFGNSSITTPCIQKLLISGIPVCYFSGNGSYFGRLQSTSHKHIMLEKKQFQMMEDSEFCLNLAKKMIGGKIANQVTVLRRYARNANTDNDVSEFIAEIKRSESKIAGVTSVEELLGYEGNAAKTYFQALSRIINPDFKFNGRNKRPPKDAFNSMLSFGYTLLMYEIMSKLETTGLNPYLGVIHKIRENHPVLCSDLMEEWRAVIVDATVLSLIQGHEISIDEFTADYSTGGIFISNAGIKIFIKKYQKKLNSQIKYLDNDNDKCSLREYINRQCKGLANCIKTESPDEYSPVNIR